MKQWSDHPFVQRAVQCANEAGDSSTLGVLESLLDIMHEVEDRFPGVQFSELLVDKAQVDGKDVARIRRTLGKNGACWEDIALVAPTSDVLRPRRETLKADPYDERVAAL